MKINGKACYRIANSVTAPGREPGGSPAAGVIIPRKTADRGALAAPWTIYDQEGQRKYLTPSEIDSFLTAARECDISVRSFCWMLAVTGCRISEALSLTKMNIDFETGHVIIQSLKKRGKRMFRAIPLPEEYLKLLRNWFHADDAPHGLLWPWSRMTGYRRICEVMARAQIKGSYATPKGLRHAFGVKAIQSNVPVTLIQKWLGHADIKTTAIYTSAMGPEEREIASRMWHNMGASAQSVRQTPARRKADLPSVWPVMTPNENSRCSVKPDVKINLLKRLIPSCHHAVRTQFCCFVMNTYCHWRQNWLFRNRLAGPVRRAWGIGDGTSSGEARGGWWR